MIMGEYPEDYGLGEVLKTTYRKRVTGAGAEQQRMAAGPGRIPEVWELDYTNADARENFLHQVSIGQAVYRGPECVLFSDNDVRVIDTSDEKHDMWVTRSRDYARKWMRAHREERREKRRIEREKHPRDWKTFSSGKPKKQVLKNAQKLIKMGLVRDEAEAIAWMEQIKAKQEAKSAVSNLETRDVAGLAGEGDGEGGVSDHN